MEVGESLGMTSARENCSSGRVTGTRAKDVSSLGECSGQVEAAFHEIGRSPGNSTQKLAMAERRPLARTLGTHIMVEAMAKQQ
jgi:hypothetical protein